MDETSITAAGAIDTFLVLLIGIGPKLAQFPLAVPYLLIAVQLVLDGLAMSGIIGPVPH